MNTFNQMSTLTRLVSLTISLAAVAVAQDSRGSIAGRVFDSSSAAVVGATVEVTNMKMGTKVTVPTNDSGAYLANYLLPGAYRIVVSVPGFKKYTREGVELRVNDRLEVDVSLEVGASEQAVTVVGETPLLNTASSSLGTVIDTRRVQELPVAHGNPYQLIGLAGGVSFTRDARLDRPFEPTHIVGYAMDGTRANRSDVMLDGAPSTATANNGEVIASYVPPADAVQEFKVQTTTFDAAFGQTEGGVTNISIKSGTNELHSSAYYNKMTPQLFANDFFANANRIARPNFNYDRWGGTVGGPVMLPKLYDGRNKTFFFFGYEGINESRPRNNGTPTVATLPMRTGDFSALLGVNSSYQIYNPFTRRSVAGGRFQQDPFPNNIVPSSLLDPVALNIQKYFADPLQPGNPDGSNNFQNPALLESIKYGTYSLRGDQNIGDKQRLFVRYSWYDRDSNYNNYFNNLSTGEWFQFASRSAVIDDVITLSPSTVLQFNYGYNRFIRATLPNPEASGFNLTSLGFPQAYADAIPEQIRRFPRVDIAGYQGTGFGGEWRPNDLHSFNVQLSKSKGTHMVRTGTEFRSYRETRRLFANDQVGRFNFDSTWTRGPLDNAPTSPNSYGQSYAAFLLGLPNATSLVVRQPDYAEQSTSWGFFVHDDWRVNRKLNLNLGLRYEFETPLTERFNRSVRKLDDSFVQPFDATARERYAQNPTPEVPASAFRSVGGLTFAGINGQPRGVFETPKNQFMPRIGLAYKLTDKTVIRAGFGVFFGFLGQRRGDVIQTGFSRNTTYVPSQDNGLTFLSKLSNPFPNGILEPVGAADGGLTFVGQSITFFNERPRNSYMSRWQFSIQRELAGGWVVEGIYVGNRGNSIEILQNFNVTPQQFLSTSPERDNTRINYLSQNMPNPYFGLLPAGAIAGLTANQVGRERLLRPFPHFDTVNASRFDGYSWYHAMQWNAQKRFSNSFTVQANYTFSKYMQATEVLNQDDARPLEVISDQDRPHRLTVSGIYELPFGRGKAFGSTMPAVANAIFGGWQMSGIYTYQQGAPLGFGNIIFNGDINNIAIDNPTVSRWFNMDAGFNRVAAQQLDRNVRNFPLRFGFIRADTINNWDLSVMKNTQIRERYNVQIRADFLNAFNSPLFPAPNTNPTVLQFGQVQASNQANYARRIQLQARFVF